jgi:hypothetical protein
MPDEPLAIVIQSSSAAGKSSLMEAVMSLVPDEARVQYSAMTGQSLFCMGESDLRHKILAIVEEAGAECAGYALELRQSEGELTIASTSKDPQTGRLTTPSRSSARWRSLQEVRRRGARGTKASGCSAPRTSEASARERRHALVPRRERARFFTGADEKTRGAATFFSSWWDSWSVLAD